MGLSLLRLNPLSAASYTYHQARALSAIGIYTRPVFKHRLLRMKTHLSRI